MYYFYIQIINKIPIITIYICNVYKYKIVNIKIFKI